MKKRYSHGIRFLAVILLTVLSAALLCACGGKASYGESLTVGYKRSEDIESYDFTAGDIVLPEEYTRYASATGDFSFALLSRTATEDENSVISPISVLSVLSMLSNGAEKKTLAQLKGLFGGLDISHINTNNHYLYSRLTAFNSEGGSLDVANSLWFEDSFDVKSMFLQSCVDYYDAEVYRADFTDSDTVDRVNGWISDKTDGEIQRLVESLDTNTVAMAVNATLFEDSWTTEYKEDQVRDGIFHGTDGDTTASFMYSSEAYLETAYAKGITKGFANTPCRFAALMPADDNVSIDKFIENLSFSRFDELINSLDPTVRCNSALPQFDARTSQNLRDSLTSLGLVDAFDPDKANFAGISNTDNNIYLGRVLHEAFIEVGPKGAKAGAATAAEITAGSTADQIKELRFDRPFVFVIYDNESNIPVFLGVVNTCS